MAEERLLTFSIFTILLLFDVLQLANTRYSVDQIRQLATHCNAEKGCIERATTNRCDLEISLKYEVPETETGKCLMTCMLKNLNILTVDNEFNRIGALKALQTYWPEISNNNLETVVEKCAQHTSNLPKDCTAGYESITCINHSFKELKALP